MPTDFEVAPDAFGVTVYDGPILTTDTASETIDVWGYDTLDVRVNLTNRGTGPITELVATMQWTDVADPSSTDWATVQVETLNADGTIDEADAAYTFTVGAVGSKGIGVSAHGRYMRILLRATGGDASSAAVATAMRR